MVKLPERSGSRSNIGLVSTQDEQIEVKMRAGRDTSYGLKDDQDEESNGQCFINDVLR